MDALRIDVKERQKGEGGQAQKQNLLSPHLIREAADRYLSEKLHYPIDGDNKSKHGIRCAQIHDIARKERRN